jgi:hypothetical protein
MRPGQVNVAGFVWSLVSIGHWCTCLPVECMVAAIRRYTTEFVGKTLLTGEKLTSTELAGYVSLQWSRRAENPVISRMLAYRGTPNVISTASVSCASRARCIEAEPPAAAPAYQGEADDHR